MAREMNGWSRSEEDIADIARLKRKLEEISDTKDLKTLAWVLSEMLALPLWDYTNNDLAIFLVNHICAASKLYRAETGTDRDRPIP